MTGDTALIKAAAAGKLNAVNILRDPASDSDLKKRPDIHGANTELKNKKDDTARKTALTKRDTFQPDSPDYKQYDEIVNALPDFDGVLSML